MIDASTRATELEQALTSPVHRTFVHEAQAQAANQAGAIRHRGPDLPAGGGRGRPRALSCALAGRTSRRPPSEVDGRRARPWPSSNARAISCARSGCSRACTRWRSTTSRAPRSAAWAALLTRRTSSRSRSIWPGEQHWTPAWQAITLAQVHLWTGRAHALRALGERLAVDEGVVAATSTRALGRLLKTAADLLGAKQDGSGLVGELERQVEEFESEVGWHELRGEVLLTTAMMASRAGTREQAGRALRRADCHFSVLR